MRPLTPRWRPPRRSRVSTRESSSAQIAGESLFGVVWGREDLRPALLRTRRQGRRTPGGSGTVAALDAGVHHIGKKIVEEAAEVWMASEYESDEEAAEEISQLLYHLQVMMIAKGLKPEDIYRYL